MVHLLYKVLVNEKFFYFANVGSGFVLAGCWFGSFIIYLFFCL